MPKHLTLYRVFKIGFVNFWRNLLLSIAATLVMTITLIIFSVLILLFSLTNYSINSIKDTVNISVYFKNGLAEDQIIKIQGELKANKKISEIVYTSAQKALENFKEKHKGDVLISQSLNELNENPLPATFNIKTYNLNDYPAVAESLQAQKYQSAIAKVNFEDNRAVIERLNKILDFIIKLGLVLILTFSFIAILVIFNTITLTIYNRREEVEIMRLVGATNWYIRGPFLVECLLYSLFATLITAILLIPVYSSVLPKLMQFLSPGFAVSKLGVFNIEAMVFVLFLASLGMSVVSTMLAIRKYLKI